MLLIASFLVLAFATNSCTLDNSNNTDIPAVSSGPLAPPAEGIAQAITPVALGAGPGAIAHYEFSVVLDYIGHRAQVTQLVEIVNPGPDDWVRVVFHLPADLQTNRFTLSRISLLQQVEDAPRNIEISADGFVTITLPETVQPNEAVLLSFLYGLEAERTLNILRRPFGDVGFNERLLQFVNWYPRLVPYEPRRGWVRWAPTQVGPPLYAEIADFDLRIQAPEGVQIASGGPVSRVGDEWQFAVQNARSIAFSASPEYVVLEQSVEGVTLLGYHLPEYGDEMQATLAAAGQALTLFNEKFGRYPYSTLVFAQDAYLPSVAAGGFVLHTGLGFAEYSGQPDALLVVLVPLTLGEMWWGHFVGHNPIAEPWLGAALPMYSEYLFDEQYHDDLTQWYWDNRIFYWEPEGPINRTAYDLETTEVLLRSVYRRGALFLHDLRGQMGDEAFFAFLRDYYQNGAFRIVNSTDFFQALSRYSNSDMSPIFDRYFDVDIKLPTPAPTLTPIPSPGPPPTATPPKTVHVVQPGETLSEIAFRYGVTIDSIMFLNGIADSDTVFPGEKLIIPDE